VEDGFDDLSLGGLGFPSLWVPAKVFVPSRDTRKAKHICMILGGQES
jgi:hypothetical protein